MQIRHISVSRTARYVTLGPETDPVSEVWFALHGYGHLSTSFADQLLPLNDGTRRLVIPEGLSRFYLDRATGGVGASWMTKEDRLSEIGDYVGFLDAVYDAVGGYGGDEGEGAEKAEDAGEAGEAGRLGPAVHILGFSQGGATACRWVAEGKVRPRRLIVWASEIPPDIDWDRSAERFRALDELLLVAGSTDPSAGEAALATQQESLRSHGVDARVVHFEGGHVLHQQTLRRLALMTRG
jgi:predicted esterase